ncbi:PepSY1/2 domain-containing protein [Ureibacillus sp. FSL K6-8385]|uniref:PepSY1/2 domain-containing protein n=1 Tax=Ureibacillus TaxID=160795 RepID=UPI002E251338|nr:germination protein YpeB [Ureibacillus terrenus]MED3762735.1 germination protein YpeB [Ureibacillus terrenus]
MKSLVYLLSIAVLALGVYAYEVRSDNQELKQTIHAQYTNSLSNASEKLSYLQRSVAQSLLFQDEKALQNELDNIWRTSNELRSSISNLPLNPDVANQWLRYLGKIGDEAKRAATEGDYESWQKKMTVVHQNLEKLTDEWTVATAQFFENDRNFDKWQQVAKADLEESPFKNIASNLKTYTEKDFPLTTSESDWLKKRDLKHIRDREITKDEAIKVLEKLVPGIKDATYTVSRSKEDAPYPFYHIQFVKGSRIGYADITVKGGHLISFLSERPVQPDKNVTQEKVKELTKQFIQRAGYDDLEIIEMQENHESWHVRLARVAGKHRAIVYPDGIQMKISKDSGELLGLNAMEYVQKENIKDQPVIPIDWKKFFRPNTIVEQERFIYTENEAYQLRLCYEVIARFKDDSNKTYRVVVDTENHDVIKVEQLP